MKLSLVMYAKAALLISTFGYAIFKVSQLPLLEQSICRDYYMSHDPSVISSEGYVPEMLCKKTPIQLNLASLMGWVKFFTLVPGLFLTVPYGAAAERVGKKLILIVNAVSYVFSMSYFLMVCYFYKIFNVKMIWLSCLFDIVGGGHPVLNMLLYTLIAERTESILLSSTYYNLSASLLAVKVLGMGLGTFLLQNGLWLPARGGLLVCSLTIPVLLCLSDVPLEPEIKTHHIENMPGTGLATCTNIAAVEEPAIDSSQSISEYTLPRPYLSIHLNTFVTRFLSPFGVLFNIFIYDAISRTCLLILFFKVIGMGIRIITQQWVSKVFHWTLAETSYMISLEVFLSGIVLVLLPSISQYVKTTRLHSACCTDLWLSQISLVFNIVGALCMSLAPNGLLFVASLAVYTMGSGLYDSLKSLATGLLAKERITKLYVGVALAESAGGLISGPLWTSLFSSALTSRWLPLGTPFLICSLCFLLALVTIFRLRVHLHQAGLFMIE